MVQTFKTVMGRQRVTGGVSSTEAAFMQSVRAQIQAVVSEYTRFIRHLQDQSVDVLVEALEPTFDLSKVYVPVDTGDLKDSGYLEGRNIKGHPQVEIGYAKGGTPDYAVYVHEHPELHHEPPTSYKFLQRALEEDFENVKSRVEQGYRTASGITK